MDDRYAYVRQFPLYILVVVVKMLFYVNIEQKWPYLWALFNAHIILAILWFWDVSYNNNDESWIWSILIQNRRIRVET